MYIERPEGGHMERGHGPGGFLRYPLFEDTMTKCAAAIFELAKTCHVIGINELHPHHVVKLRTYLDKLEPRVEIKSFDCFDALVWHPSFVQHLCSQSIQTAPRARSMYERHRWHVEARFWDTRLQGRVDRRREPREERREKGGNKVTGTTPEKYKGKAT